MIYEILLLNKCHRVCQLTDNRQAPMAKSYVELATKRIFSASGIMFCIQLIIKMEKLGEVI